MYREFELPSNPWRPLVVALVGVLVMLSMTLGRPSFTGAVTPLASDAFGRTVATGWGSLDTGQAWYIPHGLDASFDVNGSVGQMTHTVVGALTARPPAFSAADVNVVATFRAETAADDSVTSDTEFALYTRMEAEPYFRYYLRLGLSFVVGSPSPVLRIDKQSINNYPDVAHVGLSTTFNDPTVAWNLRFETSGTTIHGKAWPVGQVEPGWQITYNDTSTHQVTNAGQFVVETYTDDVTPAMVIDVDDINVTGVAAVDTTRPTIIARSPLPNATNVGLSPTVTAQFSEPVTGVGTGSFAISKAPYTVNLPAAVSYDAGTGIATLHPNSPLTAGATYRVALSGSIKDAAGNPLAWTTWNFTTALPVTFKQGTHTGYKFNASGAVTATKTYTLANNSGASATARKSITNQSGMWLAISSGVWAGYAVRESSTTYPTANPIPLPSGANATFSPAKLLSFLKGTHTGYQFTASGGLIASKTFTLGGNSGAQTTARSTKTNQYGKWFLVSGGVWAGYWVLSSDVIHLAP